MDKKDITDPHLPHALRILARDIHCEDGIATQCIREAADEIERLRLTDAERDAVEFAVQHLQDSGWGTAVLRGLLERLSCAASLSDAGQSGETGHAPEPTAIPPAWLARPYWVDPPSGHRYGFPRLYNPASDGDMTEWLIANGYPARLARQGLACTFTAYTEDGEK